MLSPAECQVQRLLLRQRSVLHCSEEQAAKAVGVRTVSGDDAGQFSHMLDLLPRRRALARCVRSVEPLGDHPFVAAADHLLKIRLTGAHDSLASPKERMLRQYLTERGSAVAQWHLQERPAAAREHIEDDVLNSFGSQPARTRAV